MVLLVSVCWLACPPLLLLVSLPPSLGDAVAVAAPRWFNMLSVASVPFIPVSSTDSLLPIMYSTLCFLLFDVCSLSPWLVLL